MHTMQRPGGRTMRVREDVLRAAEDLLVERGSAGLDVTALAARSGVSRATIHRRWRGIPGVVEDMALRMAETSRPRARHGSLVRDLRANADLVRRTLTDPRQGRLLRALHAAAANDDAVRRAVRLFYRARVREWSLSVVDAIDRGELPAAVDPTEVVRAVSAPLYHRWLTGERVAVLDATRAVDAAIAAARQGALDRRPSR